MHLYQGDSVKVGILQNEYREWEEVRRRKMKKKIFIFVPFPASNAATSYKICCFANL